MLLSIDQVAERLHVGRNQIVRWLDAGRLPYIEAGGRRFVESRNARKPKRLKPGPKVTS